MIKAILKNGQIKPLSPFPKQWRDGEELIVDRAYESPEREGVEDWGNWLNELDELSAQVRPEDRNAFHETIDAHRREQKELMRQRMEIVR